MTRKTQINMDDIDAFVFDFDGVLTNNMVHLDQDGKEWVSCSRGSLDSISSRISEISI